MGSRFHIVLPIGGCCVPDAIGQVCHRPASSCRARMAGLAASYPALLILAQYGQAFEHLLGDGIRRYLGETEPAGRHRRRFRAGPKF